MRMQLNDIHSQKYETLISVSLYFLTDIAHSSLARISRQYRSIIRDCQEQLDQESARALILDPSRAEHDQLQSELLYKLELIWHLVEVLCIERTSSK